jgi:hypothetical protein
VLSKLTLVARGLSWRLVTFVQVLSTYLFSAFVLAVEGICKLQHFLIFTTGRSLLFWGGGSLIGMLSIYFVVKILLKFRGE